MSVTVEQLTPYTGKDVKMTVKLDGQEVTDTFLLQGALPQGAVIYRKKDFPRHVPLEDVVSFEEPAPEPIKLKVKHLKAVTEKDVAQHILTYHGATVEWCEQTAPAEQVAWHDEIHSNNNLGHDHKTDSPSSSNPPSEQANPA